MKQLANCIYLVALTICSFLAAAQTSPQQPRSETKSEKEPPLISDARSVLGKVNYARAKDLTLQLLKTIRNIKAYQRDIVSTTDRERQRQIERFLDEEIGKAVEQTIEILSFLQESGFEDVIYKHKEELTKGFSQQSLLPYEREIFLNAGFSTEDFNAFVSLFESHGHEIVVALEKSGGVAGLKDRLSSQAAREKGGRYRKAKAYLKIGAGGLAIVGDGTAAIVFEIAPPVAFGILTSVTMGLSTIGDGVGQLGEEPK